jgi:hypothetical protein
MNYKYLVGILIIFVVMLLVFWKRREGFTWNNYLTQQFLEIQQIQNPGIVFDPEEIQKQASQEELKYFVKHKKWPWSKDTKYLYEEALNKNPYVRTSPKDAINTVQSIYNESAILEMLSWQAKEGKFLLDGVYVKNNNAFPNGWGDFQYNSGQVKNGTVYKCAYDASGNIGMVKITNNGTTTPISDSELETTIPGFHFINDECNPCEALNNPANYNCPFTIQTSGTRGGTSAIWKYLWGEDNV